MNNNGALKAYCYYMRRADELLASLVEFVDDMGDVLPDEVNYSHSENARRLVDDLTAIVEYTLDDEEKHA